MFLRMAEIPACNSFHVKFLIFIALNSATNVFMQQLFHEKERKQNVKDLWEIYQII